MRLERTDVPGNVIDNVAIHFVGDASNAAIGAEVCRASSASISNTPYSADESYSFKAQLDCAPNELLIWVLQEYHEVSTDGTHSETLRLFRSTDDGQTWTDQSITDEWREEMKSKKIFVSEIDLPVGFKVM